MISENDVMTEEEMLERKIISISLGIAMDMYECQREFEMSFNYHAKGSVDKRISRLPIDELRERVLARVKAALVKARLRHDRQSEEEQQKLMTLYNSL